MKDEINKRDGWIAKLTQDNTDLQCGIIGFGTFLELADRDDPEFSNDLDRAYLELQDAIGIQRRRRIDPPKRIASSLDGIPTTFLCSTKIKSSDEACACLRHNFGCTASPHCLQCVFNDDQWFEEWKEQQK